MRRRAVVATAALIAALALAGLPAPAGSRTPSSPRAVELAAFTAVTLSAADAPVPGASGLSGVAPRTPAFVTADTRFVEPGVTPRLPTSRPGVDLPATSSGSEWKPPKATMTGYATFYENGTTAMRLPPGTVVRICGNGGCILRTVTDWGPEKPTRIVDLYRPDFFRICGCASWSGTTWVTVSVY